MQNDSSKAIIKLLSEREKAYRIDYPMTQKELSDKSGVSIRSIQNFEHGGDIQLSNLIKITKALELGDNIAMLIPDVSKKPSMYLEKPKKRVRASKTGKAERSTFKWGDEE
jgi:Helix-turn-helix.